MQYDSTTQVVCTHGSVTHLSVTHLKDQHHLEVKIRYCACLTHMLKAFICLHSLGTVSIKECVTQCLSHIN